MSGYEQFHQFRLDTLRTDPFQSRRKFPDRFRRLRLDRKRKLRGETYCTQNPERIFRKTFHRVSDTADQMVIQIFHPAEYIDKPHFIVIRHRIDREIPAPQIFF